MLSGRSFIKVRNRIGPTYLSTHTLPDLNYLNSRVPGSEDFFSYSIEYRVKKGEFRVIKVEYRVIKVEYRVIKVEY